MKTINQSKFFNKLVRGYNITKTHKFHYCRNFIAYNKEIECVNLYGYGILYEHNTTNLYMGDYAYDNLIIIRYRL